MKTKREKRQFRVPEKFGMTHIELEGIFIPKKIRQKTRQALENAYHSLVDAYQKGRIKQVLYQKKSHCGDNALSAITNNLSATNSGN